MVRAGFGDPTAEQDEHTVGHREQGRAGRDEQGGALTAELSETGGDLGLGDCVDSAQSLVQDEYGRIAGQRAGQGEPLSLTTGQGEACVRRLGPTSLRPTPG